MNETDIVNSYSQFRKLQEPDQLECLVFMLTEVGELVKAYISENPTITRYSVGLDGIILIADELDNNISKAKKWTRNHERKDISVEDECGDVFMMLTKFLSCRHTTPTQAMLNKFAKKGFHVPAEQSPVVEGSS